MHSTLCLIQVGDPGLSLLVLALSGVGVVTSGIAVAVLLGSARRLTALHAEQLARLQAPPAQVTQPAPPLPPGANPDELRAAAEALSLAAERLSALLPALQSTSEVLNRHLPEIREAEAESRAQVVAIAQELRDLGDRLEHLLPALEAASAATDARLREMNERFEAFLAAIQQGRRESAEAVATQAADSRRSVEAIEAAVVLMDRAVRTNPASQQVADIATQMSALWKRLEESAEAATSDSERVSYAIRELARRFNSFSTALEARLTEQSAALNRESQQLASVLASLAVMVDQAEATLKDLQAANGA